MGDLFTAMDIVYTLLAGGILMAMPLEHLEQKYVRVMLVTCASLIAVRWIMWSLTEDSPWWLRAIVGAIFGALILTLLPSLWAWSKGKSAMAETPQSQIAPATSSKTNDSQVKQPAKVTGLDIQGHNQGSGNPAGEINSSGGGSGAEIKVQGQPGQSVTGCRVIQSGPGTGLKITQTGPGVGLKCDVTVGSPPQDKTKQ